MNRPPLMTLRILAYLLDVIPITIAVAVVCRMKVVDSEGRRLSILLSVYRNLSKLISYVFVLLGFLWAFFNPARQTWHDKIAGTYVIRR